MYWENLEDPTSFNNTNLDALAIYLQELQWNAFYLRRFLSRSSMKVSLLMSPVFYTSKRSEIFKYRRTGARTLARRSLNCIASSRTVPLYKQIASHALCSSPSHGSFSSHWYGCCTMVNHTNTRWPVEDLCMTWSSLTCPHQRYLILNH